MDSWHMVKFDRQGPPPLLGMITCWILGFFVPIWGLGFTPASAFATFVYLKFGASGKVADNARDNRSLLAIFFCVFGYALQLPVKRGVFFDSVHFDLPDVGNLLAASG